MQFRFAEKENKPVQITRMLKDIFETDHLFNDTDVIFNRNGCFSRIVHKL